ncbi:MAG: hypothetical protein KDD89_04630, partial [Anaerolineales bacterium]|nr:hypothetical protein [Anaerolineales bacterium]
SSHQTPGTFEVPGVYQQTLNQLRNSYERELCVNPPPKCKHTSIYSDRTKMTQKKVAVYLIKTNQVKAVTSLKVKGR